MRKNEVDHLVKIFLKDSTKKYTKTEIRQILDDNINTDQLTRIYKRYLYLKNKIGVH